MSAVYPVCTECNDVVINIYNKRKVQSGVCNWVAKEMNGLSQNNRKGINKYIIWASTKMKRRAILFGLRSFCLIKQASPLSYKSFRS